MARRRNPKDVFAEAVEHHRRGRLKEAEAMYRDVVRLDQKFADAWYLLGAISIQERRFAEAVEHLERAVRLSPGQPAYHGNLGEAYRRLGRTEEAIAATRRALSLKPDMAGAHYNLGLALETAGDLDGGIAAFERAAELGSSPLLSHRALGAAFFIKRDFDAAARHHEAALRLAPGDAGVHVDLGVARRRQGLTEEAMICYRAALAIDEKHARAWFHSGDVLAELGRIDDALDSLRRGMAIQPDAAAHVSMGNAQCKAGLVEDAIASYRRALELEPNSAEARSSLAFRLSFDPASDAGMVRAEATEWARRHAAPLAAGATPPRNDPTPNRRLRIGYVSPDFRAHANSLFCVPLLRAHDPDAVEVVCYSDVSRPDRVTERLRRLSDEWRDVAALSDGRLAEMIQKDGIDILVDLNLNVGSHRLLVFARKPAPVQCTWLAYPGTTGLDAIDYRITDPHLDPSDSGVDAYYVEQSFRLPETFWCYDPLAYVVEAERPPAATNGYVTFGNLSNVFKLNSGVLALWARVLREVQGSRLLLHAPEGSAQTRIAGDLRSSGIEPDRVEFMPRRSRHEYLETYRKIDVCLDTIPFNGGTTTCDAAWMGVPVVTLAGRTAVGRSGLSLNTNLGLTDLVAYSPDDFVRIATDLVRDVDALSDLRSTLRSRMKSSPLMDASRFARNMEAAYREMWRRWCEAR